MWSLLLLPVLVRLILRTCPICNRDIREEIMQTMWQDTDAFSDEAFLARIDMVEYRLNLEKERLNARLLLRIRRLERKEIEGRP